MSRRRLAAAVALAALTGCASGTPSALRPMDADSAAKGYLAPAVIARLAAAVPPPSAPASPAALADRAASERYRALEDGDRWLLATAHAELSPPEAAQHFDCALGVRFASADTPALTRIMNRLLHDIEGAASIAKTRDFRPRPVGADPERRSCQRLTPASRASASYPSSSASAGAAYGELMADLAPDRAAEARRIGREIGLSRIVCGMHYPADVAAGAALGEAVWREARATPRFAAEAEAARAEVAAARRAGLTNPGCASERLALATPLP